MRRRLAALGACCVLLSGCTDRGPARPAAPAAATPSAAERSAGEQARAFLDRWVDQDGRVVRRDQGGDTVSEGQGYALLLAVAAGDGERFARVWGWTAGHLQRPDGLLAYRWSGGRVVSTEPAADADAQVAWALALAGRRFGRPAWTAEAHRVAEAVVSREVGYDDQGRPTLAAGPWAVGPGRPVTAAPGYWTFPAYPVLAQLTGDQRWIDLTPSDAAHLRALTGAGERLPPDWAQVSGGAARPVGAPDGGDPVQHGPDAMRALVWASCTPATRATAAAAWPLLRRHAHDAPLVRDLDGSPHGRATGPLSAVEAAAVARASGRGDDARTLLSRAADLARRYPTYYGDAWAALGTVLLRTDLLGRCG